MCSTSVFVEPTYIRPLMLLHIHHKALTVLVTNCFFTVITFDRKRFVSSTNTHTPSAAACIYIYKLCVTSFQVQIITCWLKKEKRNTKVCCVAFRYIQRGKPRPPPS